MSKRELGDGEPSPPPDASLDFEKLPVRIQAIKCLLREYADKPLVFKHTPDWLNDAIASGKIRPEFRSEDYWYYVIQTLEGEMAASPGDWIIRGVAGEIYPCKPEIFCKTYKPVESGAAQEVSLKKILEQSKREVDSWPDTMKNQEPGAQEVSPTCPLCKKSTRFMRQPGTCPHPFHDEPFREKVEEVSPPSPEPRETDGHPVGWCCKHCYDGGYQAAMRLVAEGDTRELKAALRKIKETAASFHEAGIKSAAVYWRTGLENIEAEVERVLGSLKE